MAVEWEVGGMRRRIKMNREELAALEAPTSNYSFISNEYEYFITSICDWRFEINPCQADERTHNEESLKESRHSQNATYTFPSCFASLFLFLLPIPAVSSLIGLRDDIATKIFEAQLQRWAPIQMFQTDITKRPNQTKLVIC